MRYYATVASERASKGQGGNERIEVEVVGGDRETVMARLVFQRAGDDTIMMASLPNGYQTTERIKGKKQKDECGLVKGYNVCDNVDCDHPLAH